MNNKSKVIGRVTTYHGDELRFLRGHKVKVIGVIKGAADASSEDAFTVTNDGDLAQCGGVTANDRIEVQPWIEQAGRFSFVSSDPLAVDLGMFDSVEAVCD